MNCGYEAKNIQVINDAAEHTHTHTQTLDNETLKTGTSAVLLQGIKTQVRVMSETCDVQGLMGSVVVRPFARYHDTVSVFLPTLQRIDCKVIPFQSFIYYYF